MNTIINNTDYPEQYVYHYTKADTAVDHILKNQTLRFNTFQGVNDPRENKDWQFTLHTDHSCEDFSLEAGHDFSKQASVVLKNKVKMICFSTDAAQSVEMTANNILFRGFSKPAMWHHYANEHDGICLMFDRKKLDVAFRRHLASDGLFCGAVQYSNSGFLPRLSGGPFVLDISGMKSLDAEKCLPSIKRHLHRYHKDLFFRKLNDWSNESEYRWIYFDSTEVPKDVYYHQALVGILVGDKVSSETIKAIDNYSKEHKVCYQQIAWQNGFPKFQSPIAGQH